MQSDKTYRFIMEASSSEKNLYIKDTSNGNSKVYIVLLVIAICFALVAFLIAIISLSRQNGASSPNVVNIGSSAGLTSADYDDDKVWMIASGHFGANTEYLNEETGELAGFDIDMFNAVCRIANKNCKLVEDIWTNCWDTIAGEQARPGPGLMSGWYDACGAWRVKSARQRTYAFSEPFTVAPHQVFATLPGNHKNFNWQDITGKTIGFFDGTSADEHCLAKADGIVGTGLTKENIIHCVGLKDCYEMLETETIDAIFADAIWFRGRTDVEEISDKLQACPVGGSAMMTRKDSKLIDWWNPAQEKLLQSKEYHQICDDVKVAHGDWPGYDPEDFCFNYE